VPARLRFGHRRFRLTRRATVLLGVLAVAVVAVPTTIAATSGGPEVSGLKDGTVLSAAAVKDLRLHVTGNRNDPPKVTLDGRPVALQPDGNGFALTPAGLTDGRHRLEAVGTGPLPFGSKTATRSFTVDTTPPRLDVSVPKNVGIKDAVTITGKVEQAKLTADGKPVSLDKGAFRLRYDRPPGGVHLAATDAAGNVTAQDVAVNVTHPEMRGVHMTSLAWAYDKLRQPVLELAKQHKIDTVELDIKDEDGVIGYNSRVPLAQQAGAGSKIYDLKATIDELHKANIRVVGRIVAFRDPKLAQWAWNSGRHDMVIQAADGQPYASTYGKISFTNFANPDVRKYNIDIATEAAKAGFDDILYDYIRRPDGPLPRMSFPGLEGTPEDSISSFIADTRKAVRAEGSYLGISVFGIAATRPKEIAQDVGAIARSSDYVAPMVYPSHWAKGEYNVANPNAQPYDIVVRSLKDFQAKSDGTAAKVVPWLQDFSLGVHYGVPEVAAQIKGTFDDGIQSFLLWNPGCTYTAEALPAMPPAGKT
jgi:hypothetical protein